MKILKKRRISKKELQEEFSKYKIGVIQKTPKDISLIIETLLKVKIKGDGLLLRENKTIILNSNVSNYNKYRIFQHEYGHYKCLKSSCVCMKNWELSELHTFKYCLEFYLKNKQKLLLKDELKNIEYYSKLNDPPDAYTRASLKIMKSKLWEKCLIFLKNK